MDSCWFDTLYGWWLAGLPSGTYAKSPGESLPRRSKLGLTVHRSSYDVRPLRGNQAKNSVPKALDGSISHLRLPIIA